MSISTSLSLLSTASSSRCLPNVLALNQSDNYCVVNDPIVIIVTNISLSHLTQVSKSIISQVKSYLDACPKLEFSKHYFAEKSERYGASAGF